MKNNSERIVEQFFVENFLFIQIFWLKNFLDRRTNGKDVEAGGYRIPDTPTTTQP